ncbi:unnamed protein product [Schistocephalus solidus]|uniref:Uncharacterized protein n=1 Tax=Schistocephalus solidus TaxID=70667 RepID=A0A183T9D0_SCHSO|nr:unnamed protein product [Schistocephalus solidus]
MRDDSRQQTWIAQPIRVSSDEHRIPKVQAPLPCLVKPCGARFLVDLLFDASKWAVAPDREHYNSAREAGDGERAQTTSVVFLRWPEISWLYCCSSCELPRLKSSLCTSLKGPHSGNDVQIPQVFAPLPRAQPSFHDRRGEPTERMHGIRRSSW